MLYYPIGATKPLRVQGAFISEEEINKVVKCVKRKEKTKLQETVLMQIDNKQTEKLNENNSKKVDINDTKDAEEEEMIYKVIDLFVKEDRASISLIRRKFRCGEPKAARMIDRIEEMGIISPQEGNKARSILLSTSQWEEMKESLGLRRRWKLFIRRRKSIKKSREQ